MDNSNDAAGSSSVDTSSVTMVDVLKEQVELEAESDAVLAGSDEKNCTYSQGYVGRQALYACLTCLPESRVDEEKRAGVCLACSYHCHEGHELIELYTKRNFRCDCGGKRMPEARCKLDPLKLEANDENLYNQNFSGLYCICKRPYPDPEDTTPDEMIQCVVCEDWYHTRHLGTEMPGNTKNFAEMVCGDCMQRVSVLKNYVGNIESSDRTQLDETLQVDVTGLDESSAADTSVVDDDAGKVEENLNSSKRAKLDICTKPHLGEGENAPYKGGAAFWNDGWRKHLCRCSTCMESYRDLKVEFLLNESDTVLWYEENGRVKTEARGSLDQQATEAFNRMGRVQQVEILSGYNRLKERLNEFFNTFVTNNQVVTEKDVTDFFAQLKKEKQDVGTPSYFCR
ncbi:putative E3 ubiquitin-protein ligase UBR7 [Toxorhynchites rutilus septentrionalis]|uniref:putative E3 ubiquitin-protein ligase UBR7 n=1 Tax=Toxorhynchites rutilus septentrionalis TaxID=329112 RepID=UPI002479412B|nr:putative E3 ubiquitin-protein ligase UBR7 [Toxorhynchites rutilus septentrionalis]XP_055638652.1 putative E3 ubiquitin-protein ligase UBR7 [Toxorhynchites rutilus septentrionalis]